MSQATSHTRVADVENSQARSISTGIQSRPLRRRRRDPALLHPASQHGSPPHRGASQPTIRCQHENVQVLLFIRDIGPHNTEQYPHPDGTLFFYDRRSKIITKNPEKIDFVKANIEARTYWTGDESLKMRAAMDDAGTPPFEVVLTEDGGYRFCCPSVGLYFDKGGLCEDKSYFWQHILDFPMGRWKIPQSVQDEFLDALMYGANSHVHLNDVSGTQTPFPFTPEQIERISDLYFDLQGLINQGDVDLVPILFWHMARTMLVIESSRKEHKYGTPDSRLYRRSDVAKPTQRVRIADALVSFVLLGSHGRYRKTLKGMRPNDSVSLGDFRYLMEGFLAEWADSSLLASVFLSGNIGFQAIPGVNNLQKTASLASAMFAILSVATGIHHVRYHRRYTVADPEEANAYLSLDHLNTSNHEFDLTLTSCFLALPLAMMLWSIASFTVAVSAFSIQATKLDLSGNGLMISVVALAIGVVVVLLGYFWGLWKEPREVSREDEPISKRRHHEDDDDEDEEEEGEEGKQQPQSQSQRS